MSRSFSDDIAESKRAQRRELRGLRAGLTARQRRHKSARATHHFLQSDLFAGSPVVALYWPMGDELDCRGIIAGLVARGQEVVLPRIVGDGRPLRFLRFEGEKELVKGPFATLQPRPDAPERLPDMVILPLLGFDGAGRRLGYGGGYYDRSLAWLDGRVRHPVGRYGLGFDVQRQERIITGPHDQPLDGVVTESGILRFRG